jgi:hypothetical protein
MLIITNSHLLNVKDNAIQRRIKIGAIGALTKSSQEDCYEFLIHVSNEWDYLFQAKCSYDLE